MINRPRTALVSVAAVAVAMMVLGSNARAQSVSTASPQNYVRFLQGLPEDRKWYLSDAEINSLAEDYEHPEAHT